MSKRRLAKIFAYRLWTIARKRLDTAQTPEEWEFANVVLLLAGGIIKNLPKSPPIGNERFSATYDISEEALAFQASLIARAQQ